MILTHNKSFHRINSEKIDGVMFCVVSLTFVYKQASDYLLL